MKKKMILGIMIFFSIIVFAGLYFSRYHIKFRHFPVGFTIKLHTKIDMPEVKVVLQENDIDTKELGTIPSLNAGETITWTFNISTQNDTNLALRYKYKGKEYEEFAGYVSGNITRFIYQATISEGEGDEPDFDYNTFDGIFYVEK